MVKLILAFVFAAFCVTVQAQQSIAGNPNVIISNGGGITNNQAGSINLLGPSNYFQGQIAMGGGISWQTNLMPVANAPDFLVPVSLFSTNNVVTFQSPTNVDGSKKFWQSCEVWVTNTTPATPRAIITPTNCKTNGRALSIPFVTNLSICIFKVYPGVGTNMSCQPID